jgi:hypothetical protein
MAAIDLLFDVKLESERLHQLVLGSLLTRTSLMAGLGIEGTPEHTFDCEPKRGLFDLAVPIGSSDRPGSETPKTWIEIKIDSDANATQVESQIRFIRQRNVEGDSYPG